MTKRSVILSAVLAIVASIVLATMYFRFVPMGPDGAWYTYPSYALSRGGDPSENIPDYVTSPQPERPLAIFLWENRSNLTVPLTAIWLKVAGSSWISMRWFGVLKWFLIAGLVALAVFRITSDRLLSLVGGTFALADSGYLAQSIADGRPDVPIAIVSVILFLAILLVRETLSPLGASLCVLLACALPMLHVTSAVSVSFFLAFLFLMAIQDLRSTDRKRIGLFSIGLMAVLVISFLIRQAAMDALITTNVPHDLESVGQHSLGGKLLGNFQAGLGAKLSMEVGRWTDYYFVANSAHFLMLLCGCIAGIALARNPMGRREAAVPLAMMISFFAAAFAMFVIDPHKQDGHAMVLVMMSVIASLACLWYAARRANWRIQRQHAVLAGLLAFAAMLKLAHSWDINRKFPQTGISNAAIDAFLDEMLPREGDLRIVGPTELWPYLEDRKQRILIVDRNRSVIPTEPTGPDYALASFLVVNQDYLGFPWRPTLDSWLEKGLIAKAGEIGSCGKSAACFAVYRIQTADVSARGGS